MVFDVDPRHTGSADNPTINIDVDRDNVLPRRRWSGRMPSNDSDYDLEEATVTIGIDVPDFDGPTPNWMQLWFDLNLHVSTAFG